jgi:hypothetical protein
MILASARAAADSTVWTRRRTSMRSWQTHAVGAPIPATILRCAGPRNYPCRLSPRCTSKPCGLHRPNRRQSTPRSVLRRSFLHSFSNITGKTCIPYSRVLEGQHLSVHLFSGLALARTSTVNHHLVEVPIRNQSPRRSGEFPHFHSPA